MKEKTEPEDEKLPEGHLSKKSLRIRFERVAMPFVAIMFIGALLLTRKEPLIVFPPQYTSSVLLATLIGLMIGLGFFFVMSRKGGEKSAS